MANIIVDPIIVREKGRPGNEVRAGRVCLVADVSLSMWRSETESLCVSNEQCHYDTL